MNSVSASARFLKGCVRVYQSAGFLWKPRCRYWPTCSNYALEALERHHPGRALRLIIQRLSRCHPWGDSGYDPVPHPKASL